MAQLSGLSIRRLSAHAAGFEQELSQLVAWSAVADLQLEQTVREIMHAVRQRGDQALLEYTNKFDRCEFESARDFEVSPQRMRQAFESLDNELREALQFSAERIRDFHSRQKQQSWQYIDPQGSTLGQQVTPLERVGIYVPGGKAAYPSSVLMNAIPAQVAGVEEIIMVSPAPDGEINETVLAAAHLAGVTRFYSVGGAQAIAALAFGTASIPRVDKIVGPGNRFVACAKKMVFGEVGLDMVAGPSEILVVCDANTDPDWIAMDMFSQAEHDEDAQAILISPEVAYFDAVEASMARLLPSLERRDIIVQSINRRSAFIAVDDLEQAMGIVNRIAPEHLELSVDQPEQYLPLIRHAGAIFMGRHTPEAFGDYCAGPNHVLPTSTTARFASPLGVYDFQKRSSLIYCTPDSAKVLGSAAIKVASSESLTAHARSAQMRVAGDDVRKQGDNSNSKSLSK